MSFDQTSIHYLSLPTMTIAYRVLGNSGGPAVLLLHGWGSSSRYWQGTMQALAQGYTVYAPDLPGYGKSPPCDIPANPDSMAQLVMAFADTLGLEQFHLNGHSFSAAVAAHIAVGWAERVQSLTMTCPCTYHNDLERKIVRVIHHMTAVWMAMRRSWMVGKVPLYRFVSRSFFYRTPKDAAILRAIFDDFFCMDQRTALESAINAANPGYNDVLRQIATPTLIIGCRQDRVMPLYGPPLVAKRISTGRIVWIERCGHLPMMERPAIYHRILQEFLTNDQQQYFSLS